MYACIYLRISGDGPQYLLRKREEKHAISVPVATGNGIIVLILVVSEQVMVIK